MKKGPRAVLLILITILLISSVIWVVVDIQNKIREGKYIGKDVVPANTITVSGTGEVFTKPDLALITFSVKNEAKSVSEAMTENTKNMNNVIGFLKEKGIEEKDLKTVTFNVYPRYEWHQITKNYSYRPEGERVLVGYEVIQSLEVKIRDMEKIGEIIEGVTKKGANLAGNLQFTVDNQDEFKKQARKEAIRKAKAKAEELTSQLGVKLGNVSSFHENVVFPRYFETQKAIPVESGGDSTPQIETGENEISVTVTITYEIN